MDTTPPFIGQMSCTSLTASNWLGGIHLRVHLKDFYDDESGIDYYVAAIASSHHRADIVQETTYRNDLIEIYIKEAPVTDGHSYFLGIKVRIFNFPLKTEWKGRGRVVRLLYCGTEYRGLKHHADQRLQISEIPHSSECVTD